MSDEHTWLLWSSAFLIPWLGLYFFFPRQRKAMIWTSIFTSPFGLTEPLFVPEYWNPPSLFGLAQRTGFDIESLVFCFAIGGTGGVIYNILTGRAAEPLPEAERERPLHRHHYKALLSPFVTFAVFFWFPWNPIYPGILAMFVGAVATLLCRPDLKWKTVAGGGIFLVYYTVFLQALELTSPGYIARVWNLNGLSGIKWLEMPLEELLFAAAFGTYWSGVYEHFTWRRVRGTGRIASAGNHLLKTKGRSV